MNENSVILINSRDNIIKLRPYFGNKYSYLYLGRDYKKFLKWQESLPSEFECIDIGQMLHDTAMRLRRPYIDFIGNLGKEYNSLMWWSSKVAEKNTMNSPLFLYICYVNIVRDLLEIESKKNICMICESNEVLRSISILAKSKGYKISSLSKNNIVKENTYFISLYVWRISKFLRKSLIRKVIARKTKKYEARRNNTKKNCVFIRTWINEKCFAKNGKFNDLYFNNLADHLEGKGENVSIIPILYRIKRSYKEALIWFRKNEKQFLIPEDYYGVCDYFKAIYIAIKQLFLLKGSFVFEGIDITKLMMKENKRTALSDGMLEFVMYYYLMQRLQLSDFQISSFILTFENMFPEKPLLMGLKKYFPNTKTIGFQHCVLYPLELCQYVSKNEIRLIPMPDRIICSGEIFKDIMIKEGFPEERLIVGAALRYGHLANKTIKKEVVAQDDDMDIILITPSESINATTELILKVYQALSNSNNLRIWFKPHPMASLEKINNILIKNNIPHDFFDFVDNNISELIPKVRCIIAMASGVIYDAIACGVPVIRVKLSAELNFDPADWLENSANHFVAQTTQDIMIQVKRAITLSIDKRKLLVEYGEKIIKDSFTLITNETISPFMWKESKLYN